MTPNSLQVNFVYSFDTRRLCIYLNGGAKKLVELKLNLTNLNNLNVQLSTGHPRPVNDMLGAEFNVDELAYLLADETFKQNVESEPKLAYLVKCYFEIDVEFKKRLGLFLLDRLNEYYRLKFERVRSKLDVAQLKEYWLRIIDQNALGVNEPNLTSINTLGFLF